MNVRVRPAHEDDVTRITELVSANARKGGLLPRSEANIRASLRNFWVAEELPDEGPRTDDEQKPGFLNPPHDERRMTDDGLHSSPVIRHSSDSQSPIPNPQSRVVGCGSLVPMNTALVELRSLAVDENVRGGGIGQKMVAALIAEARHRQFSTIFALTRAIRFFERCGFIRTPKENFPEKVWRDCVSCPMLASCDEVAVTIQLDQVDRPIPNAPRPVTQPANIDREKQIPVEVVQAMMQTEGARSVNNTREPVSKVVLAYSGGLDTACAVPWLRENYGSEVICFMADVGQGGDLEAVRRRALESGASKCIIEDLREEFATEYLFPLIQSGAIYENKYLLGASIVRPLIAKHQVEIAEAEGADAVAHAATGKGNDQVRFELSYMALNPRLRVIAPWREWNLRGRDDAIAYANAHHVPISQTLDRIYSGDHSLWHRSREGGGLEDPWREPDPALYRMTVAPEDAPNEPEYVEVDFVCGIPKRVNGKEMSGAELIDALNAYGARHGVGRTDLVENRLVGMKSHGVYETPGGTILREAHQGIEELTLDRESLHFKQMVALRYADLLYNGQWFTPLRDALQAFITVTQRDVTGKARIKLYKGSATLVGRQATYSLYREDLATFMREDVYNQKDAEGFIRLYGLPMHVKALMDEARAASAVPPDVKNGGPRD
jgi:argininosuccinate synthase